MTLLTSGCALTSGLHTYSIPEQGLYQTDLGTAVEVVQITQNNINNLYLKPQQAINNLSHLFHNKAYTYQLSAGDVLSIQLWAYPEITPPTNNVSSTYAVQAIGYSIDQAGYINFPLVGRIKATGKSVTSFNKELNKRLSSYLKNPDAIVRVLAYQGQPFSIQGNVTKSGQYYLTDQPLSVYAAIGLAGGLNIEGDNTAIQLIRDGINYSLNPIELEKSGLSLQRLYIQPHDTIYVNSRESQKVYVMGEAFKNSAIPMRNQGMSLSDVLGESLGINPLSASAERIYVLRNDAATQTTQLYHMNLTNFADFGLANQFSVRSNDIIYVDATGLTRWQRIVNQMIPFSNALYNLDRLGN